MQAALSPHAASSSSTTTAASSEARVREFNRQDLVAFGSDATVALARSLLAIAALVVLVFEPAKEDSAFFHTLALAILYCYIIFCAVCWLITRRRYPIDKLSNFRIGNIDLVVYTLLNILTQVDNTILLCALIISIFSFSIQRGTAVAQRALLYVFLTLLVVNSYYLASDPKFSYSRDLLNVLLLSAVAFAISCWGGAQWMLLRRTQVLQEISSISNPRLGVDRAIGNILNHLREFYDADSCMIVGRNGKQYYIQRAIRQHSSAALRPQTLSAELGRQLLGIAPDCGLIWDSTGKRNKISLYVLPQCQQKLIGEKDILQVSNFLDARFLISFPLKFTQDEDACVFVISHKGKKFQKSDLSFLHVVVNSFMPAIENIRLVDRLVSEAADFERKRIARDLHDSTIQPIIGLKLGLTAVRQKLSAGAVNIEHDIEKMLQLTENELGDLRQYVQSLKENEGKVSNLISAVQMFLSRFSETSGIDVKLMVGPNLFITDRLAAEVFQMIAEAMSNVRRHTQSKRALVSLSCSGNQFTLLVQNDNNGYRGGFSPRSLTERATALGGELVVTQADDDTTSLHITIPL